MRSPWLVGVLGVAACASAARPEAMVMPRPPVEASAPAEPIAPGPPAELTEEQRANAITCLSQACDDGFAVAIGRRQDSNDAIAIGRFVGGMMQEGELYELSDHVTRLVVESRAQATIVRPGYRIRLDLDGSSTMRVPMPSGAGLVTILADEVPIRWRDGIKEWSGSFDEAVDLVADLRTFAPDSGRTATVQLTSPRVVVLRQQRPSRGVIVGLGTTVYTGYDDATDLMTAVRERSVSDAHGTRWVLRASFGVLELVGSTAAARKAWRDMLPGRCARVHAAVDAIDLATAHAAIGYRAAPIDFAAIRQGLGDAPGLLEDAANAAREIETAVPRDELQLRLALSAVRSTLEHMRPRIEAMVAAVVVADGDSPGARAGLLTLLELATTDEVRAALAGVPGGC